MGFFNRNLVLGSWGADVLTGTDGQDVLIGFWGNDSISAGAGDDVILSGSGDNELNGGAGDDLIFGGAGFDTAIYAGSVSDYSLDQQAGWDQTIVASINPNVADAGTDHLAGVEALYFQADDYTYYLDGRNNEVLAKDDVAATTEDAVLTIGTATLLANDQDFDGDELEISEVAATSASGASVTLVDGQVVYDPGDIFAGLADGETATDTFTYTVTDGNGSTVTATVTVTITGETDTPDVFGVDHICLIEGNTTFQPITSAATSDALSFSLSGADAALFTVNADTGEISFNAAPEVANPLDQGNDNIYDLVLTVTDGPDSTDHELSVQVVSPPSTGRSTVAYDMVGSASLGLLEFTNSAPDFSSAGDGFGYFQVGAGSVPFSLVDDSNAGFANDKLGIIDAASNTDRFFGATDTQNADNDGPVSASWAFDISGATDLSLSINAGAMGDFESSDSFTFTYNIDGGTEMPLFNFVADEAVSLDYTLAGGDVFTLDDPLTLAQNGAILSNVLQTLSASIEGTGSVLNVTFTAKTDGGSEAFVFQNLLVEGAGGGTGETQPPTYAIKALSGEALEGDEGTTGYSFEVTRTGDLSQAGSVSFSIGGDVDADDFGGTLPSGTIQFAPGQTCATVTFDVTGDTVVEDDETFTVTLADPVGGTIETPSASVEVLDDDDITLISEVQGDGASSDYVDQVVTVEAIVTHVTEKGFYLQEEDADVDGNDQTSEGLFVYTGGGDLPQVGDRVLARGVVEEFFGQTQLDDDMVQVLSSDNDLPTAAAVLLSGEAQNFEAIEGMRFTLASGIEGEEITVIENFNLDRYGEITVSAGTQTQATQLYDAQTQQVEIQALQQQNQNNRLIIDDGVSAQNPDEFVYIPNDTPGDNGNGYLDAGDNFGADGPTLRLGTELDGPTTGVMSFGFGEYRMLVEGQLKVDESTNSGARQADTPDVGGSIQIASVNVLNYFTTLRGEGASGPNGLNPRGAASAEDLQRQTDKLVETFISTGAEVFALQEVENGGFGDGSAIATLVDALNTKAQADGNGANYAFVDPTTDAGFMGTDAISTGIVYDANAVTLVGSEFLVFQESSAATTFALADVLNPVVDAGDRVGDFQRNRPSVAATFKDNETGETFTVVSNHFKSKGDSNLQDLVDAAQKYLDNGGTEITQADIDALKADPNFDQGNGQGFWNQVRADAAAEVQNWIENDYMGSGTSNFLIMGDMNAYAKEDPVQTLTDDSDMWDVIDQFIGQDQAYSFVFDGQQGALDHAIASNNMSNWITGAAEWHINADEPDLLNYNSSFNNAGFYEPSVFASSDHDPLIIGLDTSGDTVLT